VSDIVERREPHREGHLENARRFSEDGRVVMGGALGDPPQGAAFVFATEDRAVVEGFVAGDPYVGCWTRHRLARRGVEGGRLSAGPEAARGAAEAWREAESLLLVCLGNVCRSPFAERLAQRRIGDGRRASSAGHYPVAGRRPPQEALASARKFGVDLGSHRSRVLSADMLDEADAIFVFDGANHRAVVSESPGAASRTHPLSALSGNGSAQIADPYGGPPALYDRVYGEIAAAIDAACA